jgi:hypothetical protein
MTKKTRATWATLLGSAVLLTVVYLAQRLTRLDPAPVQAASAASAASAEDDEKPIRRPTLKDRTGAEGGKEAPAVKTVPAVVAETINPGELPPEEDKVFVWNQPEEGTQTFLILQAADGQVLQAALLVPVTVRPLLNGRWTPEQLDKLLAGRLLNAKLDGRSKEGHLNARFWLGKEAGGWLQSLRPGALPPTPGGAGKAP